MIVEEHVKEYVDSLNPEEDEIIRGLLKEAHDNHVPIIRSDVRELLRFLINLKKPMRVLEIGTAIGYSAIVMANVLPVGAVIDTIERNEARYDRAVANVTNANLNDTINIFFGDALDVLDTMDEDSYDMIFMDAAKGQYEEFYKKAMPLLKKDGIMVCDNILQEGDIAWPIEVMTRRDHTVYGRMREFLKGLKNDENLVTSILTIGDGVALVKRK